MSTFLVILALYMHLHPIYFSGKQVRENEKMRFNQWIDTFLSEKDIDLEEVLEVEGGLGVNYIPVGALVDSLKGTTVKNQNQIRGIMIRIDFQNGDVRHLLKHLAKAIAL
jgi:hypothetical protein